MDLIKCILLLHITYCLVAAMPEQGIKIPVMIPEPDIKESGSHYAGLSKSMYAGSFLSLEVRCTSPGLKGTIQWAIRSSFCANEFIDYDDENYEMLSAAFDTADRSVGDPRLFKHKYLKSEPVEFSCSNNSTFKLPTFTDRQWLDGEVTLPPKNNDKDDKGDGKSDDIDSATDAGDNSSLDDGEDSEEADSSKEDAAEAPVDGDKEDKSKKEDVSDTERVVVKASSSAAGNATAKTSRQGKGIVSSARRERRAATTPATTVKAATVSTTTMKAAVPTTKSLTTSAPLVRNPDALVRVPIDSIYMFIISANYEDKEGHLEATVETYGDYGYLSAIDWPLLPFYGIMCAVYTLSLLFWFVMCCCFRKDLLQIQYWIGAVIFIGFVEQAAFLGEYHTVNVEGKSLPGSLMFGELVSTAKRALSRMLVIIVSVGFGIVKPRLGPTLPRVVAVGIGFFILSCIEGSWRATTHKANQQTTGLMILLIVLAVVDALICWWIFTSLVRTMRTLRIRRNVHKLSLYRHFTNTLIFSVLASLGFMLWSILQHKRVECLKDWKELWVDEAFWHLLFYVILLVIMILFRPSASNQRYIYSPVADGEDDDAVEPMINESFEGMKMRGSKGSKDGSGSSGRQSTDQTEEDLKWIEDNIPASVADSTLPSLLDSEEEIMTTKYEMSKMQ